VSRRNTEKSSGDDLVVPRDLRGGNDQIYCSVVDKVVMAAVSDNKECLPAPRRRSRRAECSRHGVCMGSERNARR